MPPLNIAIVHTPQSACTCHLAVIEACARFGHAPILLSADDFPLQLPACDLLFDTCAAYHGYADWRWFPRAVAEQQRVAIVGSTTPVLRVCDNKAIGRMLMHDAGVKVPRGLVLPDCGTEDTLRARLAVQGLHFPLIVKPVNEQGSTGLALVSTFSELSAAIKNCAEFACSAALVEEYIDGREFELSILEGWPNELPIIELDGLVGLNDQVAKSAPDHGLRRIPAALDSVVIQELYRQAGAACAALGIRDYVRFDLRLRNTPNGLEPVFLEANAKPSFEREFGLDRALQASNNTVTDAIEHLIQRTVARSRAANTSR